MMKIVPIDSTGEPVDVLKADFEQGNWNLTIPCCDNQQHKEQHKIIGD
jgi:hypothetical protein